MTAPELKPCPFCGSVEPEWLASQVVCDCGASGPRQDVAREYQADAFQALNDWNRRADLAAVPAQVRVKPLVWGGLIAGSYRIQIKEGGIANLWCYSAEMAEDGEPTLIKGGYLTLISLEDLKAAAQADYEARILAAIELQPDPRDEVIKGLGPIADLLPDAVAAAEKAMRKYPQPNYVISKWAEETGEVTKDLIHMAEGRQTVEKLRGEIVQSLAMLHRLLVEGDQVHGLPPIAAALAAAKEIIK